MESKDYEKLRAHCQESEGKLKEHSVTDKKVGESRSVPEKKEKTNEQLQKELELENKIKELQQELRELRQQKIPQDKKVGESRSVPEKEEQTKEQLQKDKNKLRQKILQGEEVDEQRPVQETDRQATLEEQLKPGEPVIQERKEEFIKQLARKLESANIAKKNLEIQIQTLEQDRLKWKNKYEQLEATKCDMACVIDVISHICQTKAVGSNVCQRQLEKILTYYYISKADDKIEMKDLECGQFMEVLTKCKIVTRVEEYVYPSEKEDKRQMIDQVWNRARLDGKECVILGRILANKKGHAELCYRDTSDNGKVKIYNPAKNVGYRIERMYQEDFRKHLWDDKSLTLYTVDLNRLKDLLIIECGEKMTNLHYCKKSVDQ